MNSCVNEIMNRLSEDLEDIGFDGWEYPQACSGCGHYDNYNPKEPVSFLDADELKHEAYAQYCAHIAKGLSKEAFVFDHPEVSVIWETVENYMKADPINFPPIHKKKAEAESLSVWEARNCWLWHFLDIWRTSKISILVPELVKIINARVQVNTTVSVPMTVGCDLPECLYSIL